VVFAIGLPLVLVAVHTGAETERAFTLFRVLFLLVSLVSGVLVGGQFPLANRIVLDGGGGMSETAARLYTADLLGGWVGGIIGGVMLLPILGLTGTCLLVGMLKAISYYLISKEPAGLSVEVQR
jgi:spermidine synthase